MIGRLSDVALSACSGLEDMLVMTEQPTLLSTLSEAQRAQALERFVILRPALEEGVPQTQIARTHHLPLSTVT